MVEDLEKKLEEGKIKACPFCKLVYEIKMIDGKEEHTLLDVDFKDISPKYHQAHQKCEELYLIDPSRFKS